MALPLVVILGIASQLIVGQLLDAARYDIGGSPALAQATQSLADAERSLQQAVGRLATPLAFPANGCSDGLCANRQAPASESYDWRKGSAHANVPGSAAAGYWIEALGVLSAGQSVNCPGDTGGCEYVRVIASAAAGETRRTLDACYRIRRTAGSAPSIMRISWRQLHLP